MLKYHPKVFAVPIIWACLAATLAAAEKPLEGPIDVFLGEPRMEVQPLFETIRHPNIVVTLKGTVLATLGDKKLLARRSEDGGKTWGKEIIVAEPALQGGGLTVDETTGDILAFAEDKHPPAPLSVYRSQDHGKTWKTSKPFAEMGTGEAAIAELSDGRLYYNSRSHWNPEKPPLRRRETWSDDGGETWPLKRLVWKAPFQYSSLSAGRPGTASEGWIYMHFEGRLPQTHAARFNLSWLLAGEPTGDGAIPKIGRREK